MSIDISGNKITRSARTLICSGGWGACEGQALALRAPERVFFGACEGQALALRDAEVRFFS